MCWLILHSKPGRERAVSLGYWWEDLFVLADERHLHVLAGRSHQLPALWGRGRSLLLVAAHTDEEEKASDDQGDGDTGDQDVQNPHLAAISGTWGPQWGFHQFSEDTPISTIGSPALPPPGKVLKYSWLSPCSALSFLPRGPQFIVLDKLSPT